MKMICLHPFTLLVSFEEKFAQKLIFKGCNFAQFNVFSFHSCPPNERIYFFSEKKGLYFILFTKLTQSCTGHEWTFLLDFEVDLQKKIILDHVLNGKNLLSTLCVPLQTSCN